MIDPEIEFGDLAERGRQRRMRPDRNLHYAVVACQQPGEDDLAVFVDLDAMRDIEAHTSSDPRVELGGVLLGGQYEDEEGRPFVAIYDSLRAEHYESTKGSFKFTHDTWAQITRERDRFPDDLQIIGWYHSHPDWGVFLSTMDEFICEHFFCRPLDVALVVDPCRGDRGWFQWSTAPEKRLRRIGGFYLMASRHRRAELEMSRAQWEGTLTMTTESRSGTFPASGETYPASATPPGIAQSAWLVVAVMGTLAMQFILLAILTWKIAAPPSPGKAPGADDRAAQAALAERLDRLAAAHERSRAVEAQLELLDRVVNQLGDGTTDGIVRLLEAARRENERLKADARVYRALEARVHQENDALAQRLKAARDDVEQLRRRVAKLEQTLAEYEDRQVQHLRQIAALKQKLAPAESPAIPDQGSPGAQQRNLWVWAGAGLAAVAVVLMIALAGRTRRRSGEDQRNPQDAPSQLEA